MAHVQAMGRHLSPAFSVEFSEPSNSVSLKYDHEEFKSILQNVSSGHSGSLSTSLLPVQPPRDLVWGNLQDFMHMVQAHHDGVDELVDEGDELI